MVSGDGDDNDKFLNPFVRFKEHVDSNISTGFSTMIGKSQSSSSGPAPAPSSTPPTQWSPSMPDEHDVDPTPITDPRYFALSPYSPLRLRDLPQPSPIEMRVPPGAPNVFTFADAFEDLLTVSRGHPLPSISDRYTQSVLSRRIFPEGEPAWYTLHRLRIMGVVDGPFFRDQASGPPASPLSNMLSYLYNWRQMNKELEEMAHEVWKAVDAQDNGDSEEGTSKKNANEFAGDISAAEAFRIVGAAARELGSHVDEITSKAADAVQQPRPSQTPADNDREGPPDSFLDLFQAVSAAAGTGQRTWDVFKKIMAEDERLRVPAPGSKPGNKVVESRDEHVDRSGYTHRTLTRRELDEDGNEVSVTTSHEVFLADTPADTKKLDSREEPSENFTSNAENSPRGERSGWFWK